MDNLQSGESQQHSQHRPRSVKQRHALRELADNEMRELFLNIDFSSDTTIVLAELIMDLGDHKTILKLISNTAINLPWVLLNTLVHIAF